VPAPPQDREALTGTLLLATPAAARALDHSVLAMAEKLSVVCTHVLRSERPVLLVWKDEGELALACGRGDHDPHTIDDWALAHASHFTVGDPAMGILRVLRDGEEAQRHRVGAPWVRGRLTRAYR
jgi:hypothetical protein